jgi:hypothetical protein
LTDQGKKKWVVENLLAKSTEEFIDGALAELDAKGGMENSGALNRPSWAT